MYVCVPVESPVFLSLLKPHGPLSTLLLVGVLKESIDLAGLSVRVYSALQVLSYGFDSGVDPEIVCKRGRRKVS